MALSVGQHTNDKALSYYAMIPSGFEWEVGWNPIVVNESAWEPTKHQGISIWGHTPEGQTRSTSSINSQLPQSLCFVRRHGRGAQCTADRRRPTGSRSARGVGYILWCQLPCTLGEFGKLGRIRLVALSWLTYGA